MSRSTSPKILLFGNANIDLVLGEIADWPMVGTEVQMSRSEMRAGGSAGNTSLALSGLGIPHQYITTVGNDKNGEWLKSAFDADACTWIEVEGQTTLTVGIVHQGGDRAFFTTPGHLLSADALSLFDHIPHNSEPNAVALISGQYLMPQFSEQTARLIAELEQKGWLTAIDPGWPIDGWDQAAREKLQQWLSRVDYALLNDDEVQGFTEHLPCEEAISHVITMMKPGAFLIVKRGADGASAYSREAAFHQRPPKVEVIDTVGAGDTFNAGFLAARTDNKPIGDALLAGVTAASKAISTYPRIYC